MIDATDNDARVSALEAQLARFAVEMQATTAQLRKVEGERDEYRKLVMLLKEQVERLRRGLLGQKAERLPRNDAQLSLAILGMGLAGAAGSAEAEAAAAAVEQQLVAEHTRGKPVRKPLPADLPRVEIEIVPPEVEREPEAFECIGQETREVLERRPSSVVAVKVVYKKFVRKERERGVETEVLVGETVELPIARGSAGPGFLSDTIVKRWQDHQPLNRQEGIFAREGVALSRSTLCTWHGALAELQGHAPWIAQHHEM